MCEDLAHRVIVHERITIKEEVSKTQKNIDLVKVGRKIMQDVDRVMMDGIEENKYT